MILNAKLHFYVLFIFKIVKIQVYYKGTSVQTIVILVNLYAWWCRCLDYEFGGSWCNCMIMVQQLSCDCGGILWSWHRANKDGWLCTCKIMLKSVGCGIIRWIWELWTILELARNLYHLQWSLNQTVGAPFVDFRNKSHYLLMRRLEDHHYLFSLMVACSYANARCGWQLAKGRP